MMKGILGKKVGMTQIFDENGIVVPVTIIEAGPCFVTQRKTQDKDGYNAIQLGFHEVKENKVNKPIAGHLKKSGAPAIKYMREFRVSNPDDYEEGQKIDVSVFSVGDKVDVVGTSKGKGFAGVIKRWGFSGGPASHGSTAHRTPGSIGCSAYPARVFKGRKMPGHYGAAQVTVDNLEIVDRQTDRNLLFIKGAVPGGKNGMVIINLSKKQLTEKAVKQ